MGEKGYDQIFFALMKRLIDLLIIIFDLVENRKLAGSEVLTVHTCSFL